LWPDDGAVRAISNQYGPEHLIIQTRNARELVDDITSAGSVFLGDWSPESAGDYASGTNHVLPTYGYRHLFQPGAGGFPETHDRAGALARRLCVSRLYY
jgi:histidinol dehydrogenase